MTTYFFTINGLTVENYSFCPKATCDLLQQMGLIEDFTTDRNGEPVILYADSKENQGFGYCLWHDFIKSFFINERVAEMVLEYKTSTELLAETVNTINYLLNAA